MFQSTRLVSLLVVVVMVFAFCNTAEAEIPQYISYQGKITDSGGTPVPDGPYTMWFGIYNVASGGSPLWSSGNQSVSVNDGVANVVLGASGQPALNLEFSEDYWLLVVFEGVQQSPRVRLTSSGYSYMSSGLVPGTVISGSNSVHILKGTNSIGDGIYGETTSSSANSSGIYGRAGATTGRTAGIYGYSNSADGFGVVGVRIGYTTDDLSSFSTPGGYFAGLNGAIGLSKDYNGNGVIGWHKDNSLSGTGVYGLTTVGMGVKGEATATSGVTYGVYGTVSSASGYAGYFQGNSRVTGNLTVDGNLIGSGIGDITSVNAGTGLDGGATSGDATLSVEVPLVLTSSTSGATIWGTNTISSGLNNGIAGECVSTQGTGIYGYASASTGVTYGVLGLSASSEGTGVYGEASSSTGVTNGVFGHSASTVGAGVLGRTSASSGSTYGGYFESSSTEGVGVYGVMSISAPADRFGVVGRCVPAENWGVGVKGEGGYMGVCGVSTHTSGSYATYGVFGQASGGAVNYGVYASGDLGASGTKSAIVRTEQGPRAVYCLESTEVWFEDFGWSEIRNGEAAVRLANDFLQTVTINGEHPLKVFITPKARLGDWWVEDNGQEFRLLAPEAPDGARFDYRVVAKRAGYEDVRLEARPDAYRDHFLYPSISDVPTTHQAEWLKADAVRNESATNPGGDR
jgi:hypothetical protein